jgi:hypothetical protein
LKLPFYFLGDFLTIQLRGGNHQFAPFAKVFSSLVTSTENGSEVRKKSSRLGQQDKRWSVQGQPIETSNAIEVIRAYITIGYDFQRGRVAQRRGYSCAGSMWTSTSAMRESLC